MGGGVGWIALWILRAGSVEVKDTDCVQNGNCHEWCRRMR